MEYALTFLGILLLIGVLEGVAEWIERRRPDWADENRGAMR